MKYKVGDSVIYNRKTLPPVEATIEQAELSVATKKPLYQIRFGEAGRAVVRENQLQEAGNDT